jgi:hypothetical protein
VLPTRSRCHSLPRLRQHTTLPKNGRRICDKLRDAKVRCRDGPYARAVVLTSFARENLGRGKKSHDSLEAWATGCCKWRHTFSRILAAQQR